jgi:hypothetical protein
LHRRTTYVSAYQRSHGHVVLIRLFRPAGALAQLFDLSCISEKDPKFFDSIQDDAFRLFSQMQNLDTYSIYAARKFGDHFFQSNGSGGIVPVWDFRGGSTPDQTNAFVIGTKVAGLPAPNSTDVDWLQLTGNGDLATAIYRTHTKGGQPPSTPVRYVCLASFFLWL